jgi:hypothetical protein
MSSAVDEVELLAGDFDQLAKFSRQAPTLMKWPTLASTSSLSDDSDELRITCEMPPKPW